MQDSEPEERTYARDGRVVWGRMPPDPIELACAVRDRREEQGLSVADLAARVHKGKETVYRAEVRGIANLAIAEQYFNALGLDLQIVLVER